MDKQLYLAQLEKELKSNGVVEIDDIIAEYAQHFDNKLADGYSEEEIAAKLEQPKTIAAQFAESNPRATNSAAGTLVKVGLGFAWPFVGTFAAVIYTFAISLGVMALAFIASSFFLIVNIRPEHIMVGLPQMPFMSGLIFGIMCIALMALSIIGAVYCHKFAVGMCRAFARFGSNAVASARGTGAVLPPVPIIARPKSSVRRATRIALLASTGVFAVTLILGYVVSSFLAGSAEFWHVWNWFV